MRAGGYGWAVVGLFLAAGCSGGASGADGAPDAEIVFGCPSYVEPVAEPGETGDTYADYAAPFFEQYCIECHSSELTLPEARQFAPLGLDWDDESVVRENLALIRRAIGVLNFMPPEAPAPTCDDRLRFVTWIDSGAP